MGSISDPCSLGPAPMGGRPLSPLQHSEPGAAPPASAWPHLPGGRQNLMEMLCTDEFILRFCKPSKFQQGEEHETSPEHTGYFSILTFPTRGEPKGRPCTPGCPSDGAVQEPDLCFTLLVASGSKWLVRSKPRGLLKALRQPKSILGRL